MASNLSPASQVALLPAEDRAAFLAGLTAEEVAALEYDWHGFWARPNQRPPAGSWKVWLIPAGRGVGQNPCRGEQVISWARPPQQRLALVGETAANVRDVMVEGESGILACAPPGFQPKYEPSKRRLLWPNGTIATTYSGDAPEQLRGPQHHYAWCEEIAKWRYAQEAWDNLELGLRLGQHPQVVATTTPRPIPLLRTLLRDPGTKVSRGNTYENASIGNSPFSCGLPASASSPPAVPRAAGRLPHPAPGGWPHAGRPPAATPGLPGAG